MIKKLLLLTIFSFLLNSCSEPKKKTSEYIYKKGEHSLELNILNGNDYLVFDTPTKTDFNLKNIDVKTVAIYGPGIKVVGVNDNALNTEISVPSLYVKTDTLNIQLRFEIEGETIKTAFNIPLKKQKD